MKGLAYIDADGREAVWTDHKKRLWLWGLFVPTALFFAVGVMWLLGLGQTPLMYLAPVLWWIGPLLLYVILPIVDIKAGDDGENPPEEVMEALENSRYYRWLTYIFLPFQLASLVAMCYFLTADNLTWLGGVYASGGGLSLISQIGLTLSLGVVAGIGINTGHELGHKKPENERWIAKLTLAPAMYGHFFIEHNRGHHVRVATPEDPASGRFGETFWEFLPRSVWGSLKSSWELEKTRLHRLGKSPWTLKNDVLNAWLMTVVLYGALTAIFGWYVLPFLIIQGVYGFSLLESVNYLEHYGLMRQKTASGRYERCAPRHSWNSDRIITNVFLYHLQRHSDHHANPTRRYQTLRSFEEAPSLPQGYATLIGLTYFPPLWRKMMDHRVLEHYNGDITKVNVHPRVRDKVFAKYGATSAGEQAAA
ncbi:Alkane 1-monooxygenase OS=Tsukamurella paurometabola (strain ATCC 8368 / DSM / CCUG 35730 /CIP 100753 / JCM 10117 / KCTC 9821 / NBRC 16120 / NCIMB 702349/ NCTC 13040) OX=521096 GN=Tpau_2750 PE=3 SV=1 [Tsukamurella paurometabola]|uniref:Alkane 1-monooxygenase n=1 Tax=Tsukamurella paurometabola (strain ATCC 8368 / DSM 20162 / CCUG 35730 / CIP 100753 / JCM 10117 / KCTC 9821 / NBRC 16120 / NCIMB 702349 / NCTC 13040) TaxID=521096 RepID=D5USS7_TSUPD|nr:alkane 1-monooxygenase [Tsukamurella paurometabola]ADG79348.1 Alkane 1-monooxygenase [Tsukamurella paurometabola DSM 20162]SUP35190.1 Alkane 1-monooxygenase 1 [Tsukamurella paurometabola]